MVSPLRSHIWQVVVAGLLLGFGCGRILGIEDAHVDPILDDNQTEINGGDETDDTEGQVSDTTTDDNRSTAADAGQGTSTNGAPTAPPPDECIPFDNSRVKRLSNGVLTPLPDLEAADSGI